jgi:hypothetical protein
MVDLARHSGRSEELRYRVAVLSACGPYPSDPLRADRLGHFRAQKAAWESYLQGAMAAGLFTGELGNELSARLRNADADQFRSALAECLACWYFRARLKVPVERAVTQRGSRPSEIVVWLDEQRVFVEVKSPQWTKSNKSFGGGTGILKRCLQDASKQLSGDNANIVFLAPEIWGRIFNHRNDLTRALLGESALRLHFDPETGDAVTSPTNVFVPEGRLLKRWGRDGRPQHTRIKPLNADRTRPAYVIQHDVLVIHNPNAKRALAPDSFHDCQQLICRDSALEWTDGYPII